MTDSVAVGNTPDMIDPNAAAQANAKLATAGKPLPQAPVPDSQKLGDVFGHVPPPKGSDPEGTGTIPAVANTTLTQMPHPFTLAGRGPNLEPFGREMNHPNVAPGTNFVRDPAAFATDPTKRTDEMGDGTTNQGAPMSKAGVGTSNKA